MSTFLFSIYYAITVASFMFDFFCLNTCELFADVRCEMNIHLELKYPYLSNKISLYQKYK